MKKALCILPCIHSYYTELIPDIHIMQLLLCVCIKCCVIDKHTKFIEHGSVLAVFHQLDAAPSIVLVATLSHCIMTTSKQKYFHVSPLY